MQVTVLGAIGVEIDGDVSLGGPTQRRTLAALAVKANKVVSLDQLVDSVWPDGDAPERAARIVSQALSRGLVLLPSGEQGEVLSLTPPLCIGREALDAALDLLLECIP